MKQIFILSFLFIPFFIQAQVITETNLIGTWKSCDGIMRMKFSEREVHIEQFNEVGQVYSEMTGNWMIKKKNILFIDFRSKEWMQFKILSSEEDKMTVTSVKGKSATCIYTKENE